MNKVIIGYFKNILVVGILLFGLKFFVDYLISAFPVLLTLKARVIIFLVGTGLLLVAAIGRLGWEIQTWDGNSPAERMDEVLFWVFSVAGTSLIVADYLIGLQSKN